MAQSVPLSLSFSLHFLPHFCLVADISVDLLVSGLSTCMSLWACVSFHVLKCAFGAKCYTHYGCHSQCLFWCCQCVREWRFKLPLNVCACVRVCVCVCLSVIRQSPRLCKMLNVSGLTQRQIAFYCSVNITMGFEGQCVCVCEYVWWCCGWRGKCTVLYNLFFWSVFVCVSPFVFVSDALLLSFAFVCDCLC